MTRVNFLLPSLILVASSLALTVPRNGSDTIGASIRHNPVCDHRSSMGGGGVKWMDCYLLVLHQLDQGNDGKRFTYWKWRGGQSEPNYRHLPFPPRQPWSQGELQAQLDIPGEEPPYGANTVDTFSIADIKHNAQDLMFQCCRQGMGGSVPVAGGVVHLKIGKSHRGGPWGSPQLNLPGNDNNSTTNDSTYLGETTLDLTTAVAGS